MSPSTATPESAMNPTPAEMEKGKSRAKSATIPPTAPKGTPVNTRRASATRP